MNQPSTAENILERYLDDYELYAKECITIRDHNTSKLLPLVFNKGQRILHAVSEKMKAEKGYIRIMLLKARRFGGSTYIEGRFYWKSSLNFNRSTFIVGHEEDSTSTLYAMATLMQEMNPVAPQTRKSNAQELIFDSPDGKGLKSQYRLATAKNIHAGKSQGINYFHGSEVAMWMKGGELLSGILQCVPDLPADTEIYEESTANGYGNSFQEDIFKAYCEGQYPYYEEDGIVFAWYNPKSEYVVVFVPWFVHERYIRQFNTEKDKQDFLDRLNAKVFNKETLVWEDSEAKRLQKKYKLSLEQLYWREYAIEDKCRGSLDRFHENYPATVEEAFLSSGTSVFSAFLCDSVEAMCKDPILVGDVFERMGKPMVRPNPHGHFSLWEKPKDDEGYFMTVDSAGGMKEDVEGTKSEPDPSCIDVWKRNTGKQVGQWHGHIDYDLIGDLVEMIGNMFNRAKACVELTNHGYTVVADLKRKHYPQYEYKDDQLGWLPTKVTKPNAVDTFRAMVRDGDMRIMSKETVSEMRTFIEKPGRENNMKFNAASGCHDERIDTAGMASLMMKVLPYREKQDTMRGERARPHQLTNWRDKMQSSDNQGFLEVTVE